MIEAKKTRKEKRAEEGRLLEGAFQRLLGQDAEDNRLESEELREMLEETGHVPVTQDNVALEAGLSRKLITGADCAFPDLARRIKEVRSTHGVVPTTSAKLDRLEKDNAELRQTVVVIRSKMAEGLIRADRAEALLEQEKGLVARLRRQLGGRAG